MENLIRISESTKKIFLDFDGVLVDSNKFKEIAIEKSIKYFEKDMKMVQKSVDFFNVNAGMARELKLKMFFDDEKVKNILKSYSTYCNQYLSKASLTKGSMEFIEELSQKHPSIKLFILSGADKNEIFNFLKSQKILKKFTSLLCSEKSKYEHLNDYQLSNNDIFFGDSINDLKVSRLFPLKFILVSEFSSPLSAPKKDDLDYVSGRIKNLSYIDL